VTPTALPVQRRLSP